MNEIFGSIALTFSGGGYRAAGFSLGALSFLERIGLLQNVKVISSVSGGTITAVKYTESQISKKSFDEFFSEYYSWLKDDKLAYRAISHLNSFGVWNKKINKHKKDNPINAFAIEYNDFTNHFTIGDIDKLIKAKGTHLERVIFNAVDFTHGLEFRFQNIDKPQRRFGNGKVNLNEYIDKVKLGDALAASSAFPGGFEPISFPNDFFPKVQGDNLEEIGLMDGGIIDNQGISSLFTSDNPDSLYNFYLFNDVASPDITSPFKFAQKNFFIKVLTFLSSIPALLLLVSLTIFFLWNNWLLPYSISLVITFLMLGIQVLLYIAAKKASDATNILRKLVIPPRKLGFFILDRINSLIKMANDVFLKSARRRNYNATYEKYRKFVSTNSIYELRCKDGKPENGIKWEEIRKHTGDIPENMKSISKDSAKFGTTLWFNNQDEKDKTMKKLIACGEYTACYNLIAFLVVNHSKKISSDELLSSFFGQLIAQWEELKKEPYSIVNSRIQIK
ncbi:MAG: patatin-like phospholipase family protein [Bacteroidota bacterium]